MLHVEIAPPRFDVELRLAYASEHNLTGRPVYGRAACYLHPDAAAALERAIKLAAALGLRFRIFDGYRPWSVTKMFYDATPDDLRLFVADPTKGSRHNRGCAVDLTLYDLKTDKAVQMVGGYDEMSDRSYPLYIGGTSLQRWYRDLLRRVMEADGFTVNPSEWWHFDYKDWRSYRIGNVPFERM